MSNLNVLSAIKETFIIVIVIILLQLFVTVIIKAMQYFIVSTIGSRATWFVMNYITFIGVIHHELCHALLAFLTGAKVVNIDIFKPTRTSLGSVTYITRGNKVISSLQHSLSAIAPTVIGTLNCILSYKFLLEKLTVGWQIILFWYCWISILVHTPMSKQDIKNAKSGCIITIIILFVIILIMGKQTP